jgi:hypothetical protein
MAQRRALSKRAPVIFFKMFQKQRKIKYLQASGVNSRNINLEVNENEKYSDFIWQYGI